MDFSIKSLDAKSTVTSLKTACIVIGVFENKKLSPAATAFNKKNEIDALLKAGDITGKNGSSLLIQALFQKAKRSAYF